ncbi:hypothetical protein QFZ75_007117 [Streptomyces sp. V3I8]|nr:hypothetical protein [Streptomyces sp. V3I8]
MTRSIGARAALAVAVAGDGLVASAPAGPVEPLYGRPVPGQGDVATPADVAADFVPVQAALVLRGLKTLLDGPPGTGYPNQFADGGVHRREGQPLRGRVSAPRALRHVQGQILP